MRLVNGMPASDLPQVQWRKSSISNPTGSCVEFAGLPGGTVAVRNSRDERGPALIYPPTALKAFFDAVKKGEFDDLIG